MSWSELERLVEDAETQGDLQRALRHCRSRKELILAARRLGYRITRIDLQRAWLEEQAQPGRAGPPANQGHGRRDACSRSTEPIRQDTGALQAGGFTIRCSRL